MPHTLTYDGHCPGADYLCFAEEDIKLNSTLFLWPDQIEEIFENSQNLLLSKRDQAEMDLIKRYRESLGFVSEMRLGFITRAVGSCSYREAPKQPCVGEI